MKSNYSQIIKDIFLLTITLSVIYFLFLGSVSLINPDEGRYVEIPREMLASGNFIIPHLNGIIYFEKPILFYWIEALSLKSFGMHLFSMRLPTAIIAILGCLLIYFTGIKIFNRRTALLAAYICATSCLYFIMGHYISTDMLLSVLITATLFFFCIAQKDFSKKYFYLAYFAAGLAILTKGLVGIVLPGMIVFVWLLLTHRWKDLKHYCIPSGILLILVITLPWHILSQIKNPEFFRFYIIDEQFLRYFTNYAQRNQEIWFLPLVFFVGFIPWVFFLPNLLIANFKKFFGNRSKKIWKFANNLSEIDQIRLLLWLTVIITFFFFWHSLSQLLAYILPLFPSLALLMADYLDHSSTQNKNLWINFLALFLTFILATIIFFALNLKPLTPHAKTYFYISNVVLILTAYICLLAQKFFSLRNAVIFLIIGMSISYPVMYLTYGKFNTSTTLPFATLLKPQLTPEIEVMAYDHYPQDLPVYLQRTITIVNWKGELQPGIAYTPNANQWMINEDELWKRWKSNKKIYMIMLIEDYNRQKALYPLNVISKFSDQILVSNQGKNNDR